MATSFSHTHTHTAADESKHQVKMKDYIYWLLNEYDQVRQRLQPISVESRDAVLAFFTLSLQISMNTKPGQ